MNFVSNETSYQYLKIVMMRSFLVCAYIIRGITQLLALKGKSTKRERSIQNPWQRFGAGAWVYPCSSSPITSYILVVVCSVLLGHLTWMFLLHDRARCNSLYFLSHLRYCGACHQTPIYSSSSPESAREGYSRLEVANLKFSASFISADGFTAQETQGTRVLIGQETLF